MFQQEHSGFSLYGISSRGPMCGKPDRSCGRDTRCNASSSPSCQIPTSSQTPASPPSAKPLSNLRPSPCPSCAKGRSAEVSCFTKKKLGTGESTPPLQMLRNLHLYRLRAGRQPETWRTTNGCWGRRRWLAQQDLQKCPKRTSPLFGGVKKIATCANCAHASSGRVSWNASQNGPQTRGEHASCWGAGGGGVSAIQFPAVQNGCGNIIYLIRRRAGGEGPETLAGVDSYLATQFKR